MDLRGHHLGMTFLAAAALLPVPALAKDAAASFTAQSTASESGEGDMATQRTINTTFAFDRLFAPGSADLVGVLFEQRVASEQFAGAEGPTSELTVKARKRGPKGGYGETLWTIRDNGNEGERIDDYYRTTLYGCCGAENTYRHYYAWTGKLAFAASTDPVYASIPNTPVTRAFGYISANAIEGVDLERWPDAAGIVTLADGDRVVDRLLLETEPGSNFQWTPQLSLALDQPDPEGGMNGDRLDLWAANGVDDAKGITGFAMVLTWESQSGEVARLPVKEDRFDLTAAALPEGLTVRRLED